MPYRVIQTPQAPPEAEIDSPEMIEAAAAVDGSEQDILMLAELAEIGMDLARAQGAYAKTRLAAAVAEESVPLASGEDPTAAFNKLAQTVRRIIALKARLSEDLGKRRAGLAAGREARRAARKDAHATAVREAIDFALADAYEAEHPTPRFDRDSDPYAVDPVEVERDEMFDHAEYLLGDLDLCGDWLTRPVGETVAALCTALGFEPDMCVKRDGVWHIRRRDSGHEARVASKRNPVPPPRGEGQAPQAPGWGAAGKPPDTFDAARALP
jgi:hypothetical protein